MDIAEFSMASAGARLNTQIGMAMLGKVMDTAESYNEGLLSMIDTAALERSVTPDLGSSIDIKI